MNNVNTRYTFGYGIGTILAMIASTSINHSIFWTTLHGIFGWFYVIYYLIVYGSNI